MSVPANYINYLNSAGQAGVGALGTYAGINRGGTGGAQSALGAASRGAAGIGSLTGNSSFGQASNALGGSGNALGIYNGVQQGGVGGYGSAAINSGQLAGRTGALGQANSSLNQGVGDAANALGIYNGIKQGGVQGYGGAAINAAQLGGNAGAFGGASGAIGSAAGYIAAPLAVYNAVKNYKSGATGSDALSGAEAGAAIGSVVPVVGTAIGAVLGGLVGAGASAFGPGKEDPENTNWNSYASAYDKNPSSVQSNSPSADFQDLAGIFDSRGSTIPFYNQYGRMGENGFMSGLTNEINQGVKSGSITSNEDASDIYNKTIEPWINSMSPKGWQDTSTIGGAQEKGAVGNLLTDMIGQYIGGNANQWKGINGQSVNVSPYAGLTPGAFGSSPSSGAIAQATPATTNTPSPNQGGWVIPGTLAAHAAEGGVMKRKRAKGGALRQCFDDGGDVTSFDNPAPPDYSEYTNPTLQDPGADYLDQSYAGSGINADLGSGQYINSQNDPGAYSASPSNSQSLASLLKTYAPAIPLIAALAGSGGTKGAPAAPNGLQAGVVGPMPTPQFNRTQVANPTNRTDGQPMTQQDWYTYGSRPGTQFFNNNQVPLAGSVSGQAAPTAQATQASGAPTGAVQQPPMMQAQPVNPSVPQFNLRPVMAKGGALAQAGIEPEPPMEEEPEFNSQHQQHVRGAGDGTSDDIPAKLSDGEYVFDANTVSMLGNGSNDAGARALDQLRANLRKHAAKPMSKGKQFMKAKPPAAYLRNGTKTGQKAGG